MQHLGDGINDELRIYNSETYVNSYFVSEVCGHGFYPRQAVHLDVGSLERGVMIQFCGIN